MTKCYVCGRVVLLFKALNKPLTVKFCCHESCFEVSWKFLVEKPEKQTLRRVQSG